MNSCEKAAINMYAKAATPAYKYENDFVFVGFVRCMRVYCIPRRLYFNLNFNLGTTSLQFVRCHRVLYLCSVYKQGELYFNNFNLNFNFALITLAVVVLAAALAAS